MALEGVGWGFTPADTLIYQALTAKGGHRRTVGVKVLCEETGLPDRTIRHRLYELERRGRLLVLPGPTGRRQGNTYQVIVPAAASVFPREPAAALTGQP